MWDGMLGSQLERGACTHSMEPLKLLRKNGSISVPQSPTRRPQPPPLAAVAAVWMMGGPRLVFKPRDVLCGSASGPVGSLGREPPAHIRMPPSILLRSSGPGSDIAIYTGLPTVQLPPWVFERPLAAGVASLGGYVRALLGPRGSLPTTGAVIIRSARAGTMSAVRKRTLLKVIILGDSGYVQHVTPPSPPQTPPP